MKAFIGLLLCFLLIRPISPTFAAGSCLDGTTGNDNLTCSVSPPSSGSPGNDDDQFDADLGDDVMLQEAGVSTVDMDGDGDITHDLRGQGDGGDDTMTNYGTVTASIAGDWAEGDGGDDTIYNYGQINVNIMGDEVLGAGGNDTITNAATVENKIDGEGGNDTIILIDGANGGVNHILLLEGGPGSDTLVFNFDDPTVSNEIAAALVGQSPANGSITVAALGQTYTWTNFEVLTNESPTGSLPQASPVLNYFNTAFPTLNWKAVTWATGYQIEWSMNSSFSGATQDNIAASPAAYTFETPGLTDGHYYWHIRADHGVGQYGNWSVTQEFLVEG